MKTRETQPYNETRRSTEGFVKPHDFVIVKHQGDDNRGLIVSYTTVFEDGHERLGARIIFYHKFSQLDKEISLETAKQICKTLDGKDIRFLFKVKRSLEGEARGEIQDNWYYGGCRTAPDGTEEIILTQVGTDTRGNTLQRFTPLEKVLTDNDIYRKRLE